MGTELEENTVMVYMERGRLRRETQRRIKGFKVETFIEDMQSTYHSNWSRQAKKHKSRQESETDTPVRDNWGKKTSGMLYYRVQKQSDKK